MAGKRIDEVWAGKRGSSSAPRERAEYSHGPSRRHTPTAFLAAVLVALIFIIFLVAAGGH